MLEFDFPENLERSRWNTLKSLSLLKKKRKTKKQKDIGLGLFDNFIISRKGRERECYSGIIDYR